MTTKEPAFTPAWYEGALPLRSWRSLFKWGSPNQYKHPNRRFFRYLSDQLNLREADFCDTPRLGLEEVTQNIPPKLDLSHIRKLSEVVGENNTHTDIYSRLKASYGYGCIDCLRLREKQVENLTDVVLYPENEEQIVRIVEYANLQRIPIYPLGGGTSVTRGFEAVQGGISLDMSVHMKRVIEFNEIDQTITVQPGIMGPDLENLLNNAPKLLNAQYPYTCGHFPQSFEFSSVGGWVATRGAGQNSTYYGKIEDLVLSQRWITPAGLIETPSYPRAAIGPDLNQVMIGSEGIFGVLTSVTLKLYRYLPENRHHFAFMFRNWAESLETVRAIMQSEAGFPSVLRLSDPEETDVAMKMYGIEGTIVDVFFKRRGFLPMSKTLLLGWTEGERAQSGLLARRIRSVAKNHGAFNLTFSGAVKQWERGRYLDPYMRDDLSDFGILTDTLECAVRWSTLDKVYERVRRFIKSHPETICMTHLSHAYPQGANLYFIFMRKQTSIKEYLSFQYSILDEIRLSGASMSHHHGIGKQTAPWLVEAMGRERMGILSALKNYFDPNNIMNPGGTLGLDMSAVQSAKRWNLD